MANSKQASLTKQWLPVFAITIMAISMIGYLASHSPNFHIDQFIRLKPVFDLMAGENYTSGDLWHTIQPAGGFITYFFTFLLGDIEYGAMAGSILSYTLLVPLLFYCGKYLFDYKTGIIAAIFLAFCPTQIWLSHQAISEPMFELILFLGFISHVRIILEGPSWRRCIIHGIITGTMWLFRAEGFLPMVLSYTHLTAILLVHHYRKQAWGGVYFNRSVKMVALSVLLYLITAGPWIGMVQHYTGKLHFIGRTGVEAFTDMTVKDGRVTFEYVTDGAASGSIKLETQSTSIPILILKNLGSFLTFIKVNLPTAGRLMVKVFKHIFIPLLLIILISFLFPRKALLPISEMSWRTFNIFTSLFVFASPIIVLLMYWQFERFYLPYYPYFILLFSTLTNRLVDIIPVRSKTLWAISGAVFFAQLLLPLPGIPYKPELPMYLKSRAMNKYWGTRAAGEWLATHCKDVEQLSFAGTSNYRNMRTIAFMASGKNIRFEDETDIRFTLIHNKKPDIPSIIKKLLDSGETDVLVLDDFTISFATAMQPIWNNPKLASDFGLVMIHQDPDYTFQIYGSTSQNGRYKCHPSY
jgi:4-amino-4-deoxy-L-arabinose transferase-like glycosyltransferase